ncbi:MAG TPA: RAMP superfamily CRISPR-associated protein [Candidatus Saccharimonadales bacterium]|jgi:CRISPR-associated protein Csx10|nr:RAMP superfamily CRISPR-associated protein [Candidatus Saccharimonadales bacterium]
MIFRFSATLETPVAISKQRATGNSLETLNFIPGTVLRGAMAEAYLRKGRPDDAAFATLFLEDNVRFGNLRLGGYPRWPLSARWCKQSEDHPQFDLLCLYAARELSTFDVDAKKLFECTECGSKIAHPGDGYRVPSEKDQLYKDLKPKVRRQAHVEIDPEFQRSRNGRLYSANVMTREQTFEGRIWASEKAAPALKTLAGRDLTLWLGRGRSRGQGRVTARLEDETPASPAKMRQHIEALNQKATDLFPMFGDRVLFSCTMQSPAILLDQWLLSKGQLAAADIDASLNEYKLLACFTRPADIAGWNAAPRAQLPKAEVRAIAAGSCFLFAKLHTGEKKAEYARLAEALARAEDERLGERREEGFGEAAFCERFHYEGAIGP